MDWYVDKYHGVIKPKRRIQHLLYFEDNEPGIASDPIRVCMCISHVPNCNITDWNISGVYPGQTVDVDIVVVGQRYGTVVTRVTANSERFLKDNDQPWSGWIIKKNETIQKVQKSCTTLKYTIMSPDKEERLFITALKSTARTPVFEPQLLETYPYKLGLLYKQLSIKFLLNKCPIAFPLDRIEYQCTCSASLRSLGLSCNLNTHKIHRNGQQWVGVTIIHTIADENPGVIAHQHCPFDYNCKTDLESLSVSLEHQDEQCAFNHSGILCGGCQTNFSRVLGSSKCKKCSNLMLFAIIPGILLAGLFLVIILMVLNLTVSVGTISGLIFYANIIQVQHTTFFTPDSTNSFLSMFIAWLNFDFGIESCLYNGFDAYMEAWLQFCFPLYIWLLVTAIIVFSHYSTFISKLIGENAVQVLATLFLLSYTKFLRHVIDVFSFTTITYPDGYTKTVWLYDGNVDFLKGKHIPLFTATLLLLVLSIPYTLSLVSIQWFLKVSHHRAMFWVQRLKPFFDAYTGPYKINHRYWTGLLLLARIVLLVIFSLVNQSTIILLIIIIVTSALQIWLCLVQQVYESFLNNCLEMIFLFNLGLTSAAILFELSTYNSRHTSISIYISTGITFVIFVGIIFYHAQKRLISTRVRAKLKTN